MPWSVRKIGKAILKWPGKPVGRFKAISFVFNQPVGFYFQISKCIFQLKIIRGYEYNLKVNNFKIITL